MPTDITAGKLPAHLNRDVQFKPGQSGNPAGRPKGARAKLGEAFLMAMQEDFAKHGIAAVESVRNTKPDQYLKVIASLMPKEIEVGEETAQRMVEVLFRGTNRTS